MPALSALPAPGSLHFLLCMCNQKMQVGSKHSSFSQSVSMRDYIIYV